MKCTTTKTEYDGIAFYGVICDYGMERIQIKDITTNEKSLKELCRKIEKGNVTPVTLMDIINDFME